MERLGDYDNGCQVRKERFGDNNWLYSPMGPWL